GHGGCVDWAVGSRDDAADERLLLCLADFFFQAEDGIRDFHVTGVQTCALPISMISLAASVPTAPIVPSLCRMIKMVRSFGTSDRSEERRVGKEGRRRGTCRRE